MSTTNYTTVRKTSVKRETVKDVPPLDSIETFAAMSDMECQFINDHWPMLKALPNRHFTMREASGDYLTGHGSQRADAMIRVDCLVPYRLAKVLEKLATGK